MNASDLLKTQGPAEALQALQNEVRARPADFKLRVFLAQLLCVLGQWERALNQLSVAAGLDALAVPMQQVYGDAIRCEGLRRAVFAGERTPMVFGQPDAWLACLLESMLRAGHAKMLLPKACASRPLMTRPPAPAPWTARPSPGWPMPTCAWGRCWRPL